MINAEQGINVGHVGLSGEFKCIVRRADGTVKVDTGYQKNLILNQGLDVFGGATDGNMLNLFCVIGSGNSTPTPTQNQLDSYLAVMLGSTVNTSYNYTPDASNLYKTSITSKFTFTGLNNVNVSELGLSATNISASNYHLTTRALIKDAGGNPTAITILSGEVLDIYYKVWQVFSTLSTTHTVNMLNGKGGSVPYNVSCGLLGVGLVADWYGATGVVLNTTGSSPAALYTGEFGGLTEFTPQGGRLWEGAPSFAAYVGGSYKRVLNINLSPSIGNGSIRTVSAQSTMGKWQLRYGSVANDSPIVKTDKESLVIPIEFSWGRYEGVL